MAKKRSMKPLTTEKLEEHLNSVSLPSIKDLEAAYEALRPYLLMMSTLWIIPAKVRELLKKFIEYADAAEKLV